MNNSNLPVGCANDSRAPWNQNDTEIDFEIPVREVYTLCCGIDQDINDTHCKDCGCKAEMYVEPFNEFQKRIEQAKEDAYFKHIENQYDQD